MANSTLYPPILNTYSNAFLVNNMLLVADDDTIDLSKTYYTKNNNTYSEYIIQWQNNLYEKTEDETGNPVYTLSQDGAFDINKIYYVPKVDEEGKITYHIFCKKDIGNMPLYVNKNNCYISLNISSYNSISEIGLAQVSMRNQATNISVLDENKYPEAVMYKRIFYNAEESQYYIVIDADDMMNHSFDINMFYKIQIRFTNYIEPDNISDYLKYPHTSHTGGDITFSEWSSITLVKGISTPTITYPDINPNIEIPTLKWDITKSQCSWLLTFADANEEETLRSYQIKLYSGIRKTLTSDLEQGDLLADSGILYSAGFTNPNSIIYNLQYGVESNKEYIFVINYITKNLYAGEERINMRVDNYNVEAININLSGIIDENNARAQITVRGEYSADPLNGTLTIKRTSNKSNFSIWEDMQKRTVTTADININYTWSDYTIESGVWYLYALQYTDNNNNRGAFIEFNQPIMLLFDDMFLVDKNTQLNIKFNPQISNYKRVYSESKTETLGAKYPFIRRNGNIEYTQFTISGLISSKMDEDGLFYEKKTAYGKYANKYEQFNQDKGINPDVDYIYEKQFRDEVMEFLYNDNAKLFRSATEGNHIVKLMDISLTPEKALGRLLYSFSATAYEVADFTVENCGKAGILPER